MIAKSAIDGLVLQFAFQSFCAKVKHKACFNCSGWLVFQQGVKIKKLVGEIVSTLRQLNVVGKSVLSSDVVDTLVSVEIKVYGVVHAFCSLPNAASKIAIEAFFDDEVGVYVAAYPKCFVAFCLDGNITHVVGSRIFGRS